MASPSYRIVEYDPRWPVMFDEEKPRIVSALGIDEERVVHIGSTAVPRVGAKPIVDVMAGVEVVPAADGTHQYLRALAGIGYECRGETVPGTLYIRKPEPRFNLHMTEYGGEFWVEHLLFLDYLRANPETARDYERLKREIMARLAESPPEYNEAKAAFIRRALEQARNELPANGPRLQPRPG